MEATWVAIAITGCAILCRRSKAMALWLVALAVVCLAVSVLERCGVLSKVSLSDADAKGSAVERDQLQALRVVVASARTWAHCLGRICDVLAALAFYAAPFGVARIQLRLPRHCTALHAGEPIGDHTVVDLLAWIAEKRTRHGAGRARVAAGAEGVDPSDSWHDEAAAADENLWAAAVELTASDLFDNERAASQITMQERDTPRARRAFRIADAHPQQTSSLRATMNIRRSGSQPSARANAEWFTGAVRIDPLLLITPPARAAGNAVTFEPGARTAWHTHPLGQLLIVTAAVGRAQREGGPVEEIRPGDVVWFDAGERHWHGASPTMTQIAIQRGVDGRGVDWLENVTDEQSPRARPPSPYSKKAPRHE
jgi:quercetin dioxygenase-like cupin family protein